MQQEEGKITEQVIRDYYNEKAPRIEISHYWNAERVRKMCIKHQLYTTGTLVDYNRMLEAVNASEPTDEAIYLVAKDINAHSDYQFGVSYCMELLLEEAVFYHCRILPDVQQEGEER